MVDTAMVEHTGHLSIPQEARILGLLRELLEVAPRGVERLVAKNDGETFELVAHYSALHTKVKQFVIWDVARYKRFLKDLNTVKAAWSI